MKPKRSYRVGELDYLADSVSYERNMYILGSIVVILIMVTMFFLGWLGGIKNLADHPATTDCRPPQTLSDKVVATLKDDGNGGLKIECHYETIKGFSKTNGSRFTS